MRSFIIAAALAASCSPRPQEAEPTRPERPVVEACSGVSPNAAQQVAVETVAAIAAAADLRGGPIAPGVYDLTSAHRVGAATGWRSTRAVALEVSEAAEGVVFNWASVSPEGQTDSWTANFRDAPGGAQLIYTCGRIGEVEARFAAGTTTLQLRLPDGADGELILDFQRRP